MFRINFLGAQIMCQSEQVVYYVNDCRDNDKFQVLSSNKSGKKSSMFDWS